MATYGILGRLPVKITAATAKTSLTENLQGHARTLLRECEAIADRSTLLETAMKID